jgi:hypothetical protein
MIRFAAPPKPTAELHTSGRKITAAAGGAWWKHQQYAAVTQLVYSHQPSEERHGASTSSAMYALPEQTADRQQDRKKGARVLTALIGFLRSLHSKSGPG